MSLESSARQPRVTRRQAVGAGTALALGAAALASPSGAGARSSAQLASVTLEEAERVLDAAIERAGALGVPMFVVVVDAAGIVKASRRMDGNGQASVTLAPLKAQTANGFRTATHVLAQNVAGDPARLASIAAAPGFTLLPGGVPLRRGGAVIGAVGVGGGSPAQDVEVAEAGASALG